MKIFAAITFGGLGLLIIGAVLDSRNSPQSESSSSASADSPTAPSSAPAATGPSDDELVQTIWAAYENMPGNQDSARDELHSKDVQVHGELVRKGSVLPKAMNSSVTGRLPAYLACYDYIQVMTSDYGGGDMKSNLCIYYIENPVTETNSLMWRGKDGISELESQMSEDGFIGAGGSAEPGASAGANAATPAPAMPDSEPESSSEQSPVASVAAPAAPSSPPSSPAPTGTASGPDNSAAAAGSDTMNAADTVRAFYAALGRGDGTQANMLVTVEKRTPPAYQPDAIDAFYGHMAEPLKLTSVTAVGPSDYEVRYQYRKQTALCNGQAIVTTEQAGSRILISRIRPLGNC